MTNKTKPIDKQTRAVRDRKIFEELNNDTIDKFLNEEWVVEEEVEVPDLWKHIHEFAHRYDCIELTCDGTFGKSIVILESMGYGPSEIIELLEWFKDYGAKCDCEVSLNILMRYAVAPK